MFVEGYEDVYFFLEFSGSVFRWFYDFFMFDVFFNCFFCEFDEEFFFICFLCGIFFIIFIFN